MTWLFKLQDILPQIITVKHCKGANNTAADYISRHFPPSTSTNINPSTINVTHDYWPIGDSSWSEEILRLKSEQFMQSSILNNTCIYNAAINTELNAVTTRAQAKLQAEPPSSTANTSSTSTTSQSTHSSSPTTNQLYDFSLSRIRSEQAHDATIQQIRNNRRYNSFILQAGILYKLVGRDDTTLKLVYASSRLIPELMAAYHDHPLSGQFGIGRTWPTKCSQFNVDRHKPPGFLQPMQPSNDIFQILGMDWLGPTTTSLSGNRYVLVVTDRLSGYVFVKASPTNTAQDTARILMEEIILVHGSPDIIITDQETHFKNELLQAVSKLAGCQHIFSTPYHPQTNGQTERWNSTFATRIAKYCNTDQTNRDTFLPYIVYAYNHGIYSSTGFSPYQLASTFIFSESHDYWTQVIRYRNTALKQAHANILHQQQLSKTRFDKNRSHPSFVLGNLVCMKILVGRHKLKARDIGPARIIRIL
ncbi:unnamed protein product [Rotaria magnacalcarata]|nr:unnamed protein product [Rotaria magnacalcarata]CAF1663079.1 unnamed protein product [Rotaria magnacalcarata]CAF2126512.1 unnamed protein product [Rotaria magnacalcarata]